MDVGNQPRNVNCQLSWEVLSSLIYLAAFYFELEGYDLRVSKLQNAELAYEQITERVSVIFPI